MERLLGHRLALLQIQPAISLLLDLRGHLLHVRRARRRRADIRHGDVERGGIACELRPFGRGAEEKAKRSTDGRIGAIVDERLADHAGASELRRDDDVGEKVDARGGEVVGEG